jgi:hypothetical protein
MLSSKVIGIILTNVYNIRRVIDNTLLGYNLV